MHTRPGVTTELQCWEVTAYVCPGPVASVRVSFQLRYPLQSMMSRLDNLCQSHSPATILQKLGSENTFSVTPNKAHRTPLGLPQFGAPW